MSCIDEQTLGAFVEGTLDARQRREVMEHLDRCESCTAAAGLAAEALREESPAIAQPSSMAQQTSSRAWFLAAAAMLATVLVGLAVFRDRLFVSSPVQTLVAAAPADRREVEPRLRAGEIGSRPSAVARRGGRGARAFGGRTVAPDRTCGGHRVAADR